MKSIKLKQNQSGAALLVALSFLVVITLISITSMRSSTTELRLANNNEQRVAAEQAAQSAMDNALSDSNNFLVKGTEGNETTVTLDSKVLGTFDSGYTTLKVVEGTTSSPPRGLGVSADKFQGTQFYVEAEYDDAKNARGRAFVGQGIVLLIPKT